MVFEKIINTAYSFGAAIVVFGAWGKLEHMEFGSTALTVGMLTETAIFFIYGLREWRTKEDKSPAASGVGLPEHTEPVKPGRLDADVEDLTDTMKQTNRILTRVFKTEA